MTRFALQPLGEDHWKKWLTFRNRYRSRPGYQFHDLVRSETERLRCLVPHLDNGMAKGKGSCKCSRSGAGIVAIQARLNVRDEWKTLGIWRPQFECLLRGGAEDVGDWAHENYHRSTDDKEVKPENSRPFRMFMYQLSKRREQFSNEFIATSTGTSTKTLFDIILATYLVVRRDWERRKIWIDSWRTLPGDFWAHEINVEDWYDDDGSQRHRTMESRDVHPQKAEIGVMERYRRRVRKSKRRAQWTEPLRNIEGENISDEEEHSISRSDSAPSYEKADNHSSTRSATQDQCETSTAVARGATALPNEVLTWGSERLTGAYETRQMQDRPDDTTQKSSSEVDESRHEAPVLGSGDAPMCLGHDCMAYSHVWWEIDGGAGKPAKKYGFDMPGTFPGDD
ncbi:hypothetical protein SCUP234_10589 [Seiridium cupressi]